MSRIFVAGSKGMVGSAIVRALEAAEGAEIIARSRSELDLRDQSEVRRFFATNRIDQVYLAAAKVGGIHANNIYPADFIFDNLAIQTNVIHEAFASGVRRLLFLGSSCIYPKDAPQPMSEAALLTGVLEPTNEPYAIAKIAGIKMCESYNRQFGSTHGVDFRSVMPTNLYGPGDNYHLTNSHVVPALIRRFVEAEASQAPSVTIWGTGTPMREFLHVDDMARASIFVMGLKKAEYESQTQPMLSHINVGCGEDVTIIRLAHMVASAVGYSGNILTDPSKPDGTMRKLMDSSRLRNLGWTQHISLEEGLALAVADYRTNHVQ
jgi:GDP-L-fucose synthase